MSDVTLPGYRKSEATPRTQELTPLEEVCLSIQHPIVQAPLIGLVEQQVEVLERLSQPERLFRIL